MKLTVYTLNRKGEQVVEGHVTLTDGKAVASTRADYIVRLAASVNAYPDPADAMRQFARQTGTYTRHELTEDGADGNA